MSTVGVARSQTPIITAPTGSQTITQPAGTAFLVNGSGSLYVGGSNPQVLVGFGSLFSTDGNEWLQANNDNLILDTAAYDAGSIIVALAHDASFWVQDGPYPSTPTAFFCADTSNDWVGVDANYSIAYGQTCSPWDLFDVSNRETFGDGYMHWWANAATPVWNSNHTAITTGWNAGVSNPSNGKLSFDSTTDHDGLAQIALGTLTLTAHTPSGAATGGSITFPDSTNQSTAWNGTTLGGDYAEAVDVLGERTSYEPGDVIVIDDSESGKFVKSTQPYSRLVAGVYSTKPGLLGRRTTADRPDREAEVPMAMMGIVPTKVSTENGPIERGDLLVSSSTPGYAMRGTDSGKLTGAVIGKALAPLQSGSGVIEVLISLQ
jgi:hypothetical protein